MDKLTHLVKMLVLLMLPLNAFASLEGPSINDTSNFRLTWTNTADNCGYFKYYIYRYKDGNYAGNNVVRDINQRHYDITVSSTGVYTFELKVARCTSSGAFYALGGTTDVSVLSSSDKNRTIKFIHTDILGTPVAETDKHGDVK